MPHTKSKQLTKQGGIHMFKVHLPNLLHEIADAGLTKNGGVLAKPLQISQRYLISIAQRAVELNDPVMNKIMCDLALWNVADPTDPEYNQAFIDQVNDEYQEHLNKQEKS